MIPKSLVGASRKVYEAIEDGLLYEGLGDAPKPVLLEAAFYHTAQWAYDTNLSEEDAIELFRKTWQMVVADKMSTAREASLEEIVGRTVIRVDHGKIEQEYGEHPTIILHFSDNTYTEFVLPFEDEDED